MFFALEQGNRIVVAFTHLASVQALQYCHIVINHSLRQGKHIGKVVIESLGDIPRHFHVLNLVPTHGNPTRFEHKNIRRHQHRIAEQPHGYTEVWILSRFFIGLHRGLVCVSTVHKPLGGIAAQHPGKLRDLRNIRLAIEQGLVRVQPQSQPGGCNLFTGLAHKCGVPALNQGVIVSEKKERVDRIVPGCSNGWANSTNIVAQVRCAGSGNPGKNALLGHEFSLTQ